MKNGKYKILTKRHLAVALVLAFLLAVLVVIAAAAIPYAYANAVASSRRKLPIYCTDRADQVISITFDAAWGDEDTQELIDILARYNAKATFFVTGEWVDRCTDSVKALHDAGHEIMNHSDTHPHMPALSRDEMIREINTCSDKIQAITGVRPPLFRAPYGDYDNSLIDTADMLKIACIQWDVDSLDWKGLSAGEITKRVTSQAASGSIVLFHNGTENTPQALSDILRILQEEGYTFLPVSEMIYTENYTLNHEGRQIFNGNPSLGSFLNCRLKNGMIFFE